uniref:WW domain-containing protein n=1 Tax=Caenorhabditis tropicalis TaxID=1561998 RepID=A0A1I7UNW1_9PELO
MSNQPQPATWGIWNEQRSSNGKWYYYNTRTEKSQWYKPNDWPEGLGEGEKQRLAKEERDRALLSEKEHPADPE